MMYPLVLVKSYGSESSIDIIKAILKESEQQEIILNIGDSEAYECQVNTKYYDTNVALLSVEKDLSLIPLDVLRHVEAVFFYYDSNDKTFLKKIDSLCKFVENNNIEVAALLTRGLHQEESHGITYTEIKNICKESFGVIDLTEQTDAIDDKCGEYFEIWDLLKNTVWSTVEIPPQKYSDTSLSEDADNMEEQLNIFEELLTKVQTFKESSKTLTREQLLNNAEQLADLFINVMVED